MNGHCLDNAPISPSAINDLEEFLRDIPSPTVNYVELMSQKLSESPPPKFVIDQSSSTPPSVSSAPVWSDTLVDPSQLPVEMEYERRTRRTRRVGTRRKRRPPKRKRTNAADQLVLNFNGDELLNFFAACAKPTPKSMEIERVPSHIEQTRTARSHDPDIIDLEDSDADSVTDEDSRSTKDWFVSSTSFKSILSGLVRPDMQCENDRLSKENECMEQELRLIHDRNLDSADEVARLRSLLYNSSKLAPLFRAAEKEGKSIADLFQPLSICIPTSAVLGCAKEPLSKISLSANMERRFRAYTPSSISAASISSFASDHDHNYSLTDTIVSGDSSDGVCVHIVDGAAWIGYCDKCGFSAQSRAQENDIG